MDGDLDHLSCEPYRRSMKLLLVSFMVCVLFSVAYSDAETMNSEKKYSPDEAHLLFAKQANGETWKLLQKDHLSPDEKDVMLYAAFASAYHWQRAGTLIHKQRGEWLISRTYAKLGMGQSALFHAEKCLHLSEISGTTFKDFDYAYAFEAMARSYALIKDFKNAAKYYKKAKLAGEVIKNKQDRQLFMTDMNGGNWNGFLPSQ